ncbi:methylenetetrahydrofolate reductase [Isoptericola sediminis]|uniref:Methylenetetrahydrofolate reductase n=1 Tax=Isoptericola sediminis TaxID=2733572 RepID=A0A849K203_9MICO|nr:methylenetetrahydrofolate reductase [Isoptericola sediminis]NNU26300.1 5,10-methylenetetrahydrofolate reductase [Isoptericola sediminis]
MAAPDPPRPWLLFAITPPRRSTEPAEAQRIADRTCARLRGLDLDALVIYDIDDESDRTSAERPFPYLPTLDPGDFHARHLQAWDRPVIVYRSAGKHDPAALGDWFAAQDPQRVRTVLVGASSSDAAVRTTLSQAQRLRREHAPDLPLGGVAIPERHASRGDEHERMRAKQAAGVSFFVTQVVYDVGAAKSMVSDYHYACGDAGQPTVPVVFTLSVCGSARTLAFLEWLGVHVPGWMRNDLRHTDDPLGTSYDQCVAIAEDLAQFCTRHRIPYGFNVESVSIRRAEIEASVRLAAHLRARLDADARGRVGGDGTDRPVQAAAASASSTPGQPRS